MVVEALCPGCCCMLLQWGPVQCRAQSFRLSPRAHLLAPLGIADKPCHVGAATPAVPPGAGVGRWEEVLQGGLSTLQDASQRAWRAVGQMRPQLLRRLRMISKQSVQVNGAVPAGRATPHSWGCLRLPSDSVRSVSPVKMQGVVDFAMVQAWAIRPGHTVRGRPALEGAHRCGRPLATV